MLGWWSKRKLAKIADRQHRWVLKRIGQYVDKLYDSPNEEARHIARELMRAMSELPPKDFK